MTKTRLIPLIFLFAGNAICGDTLQVLANRGFEITSAVERSPDTLVVVTCAAYVFYPFGQLKSSSELQTSPLRHIHIRRFQKVQKDGVFQYYMLQFHSSHLILFFDDDKEAERSSYIMNGEIADSHVGFAKRVRIGMTKEEFASVFFVSMPTDRLVSYNAVEFESCVEGIRHIYEFEHNRLKRVRFQSVGSIWHF